MEQNMHDVTTDNWQLKSHHWLLPVVTSIRALAPSMRPAKASMEYPPNCRYENKVSQKKGKEHNRQVYMSKLLYSAFYNLLKALKLWCLTDLSKQMHLKRSWAVFGSSLDFQQIIVHD